MLILPFLIVPSVDEGRECEPVESGDICSCELRTKTNEKSIMDVGRRHLDKECGTWDGLYPATDATIVPAVELCGRFAWIRFLCGTRSRSDSIDLSITERFTVYGCHFSLFSELVCASVSVVS